MFMVKKLTGSNAMVGYVGAVETLPYLIFGPYAGVLADRMDRKRIMLVSDLLCGSMLLLFAAVVAFSATPPVWLIMVLAFCMSTVRCFFFPAKGAAIPALVPADMMLQANSVSAATQNLMPLIGLAASAGLLSVLYAMSPTWCFLGAVVLNAISFLISAWYIRMLPEIKPDRVDVHETHPMRDFVNGISYVIRRHDLSVLVVLLAVFRLTVAPFFVVYIAANDAWFGGKPQTIAWFEASFFLGMVVASHMVGHIKARRPARFFCWGLAFVGVTVAALGVSPIAWLFVFWNLLAGLAVPIADIPMNTYMQVSVPDQFRGRVNSVVSTICTGVMPVGMAMGGILVDKVGVTNAFVFMGAGMMLACLAGLLDPRFRDVELPGAPEPEDDIEPALELSTQES
jgi:DHA3 family macrolide efflux protein-like MFS transporter